MSVSATFNSKWTYALWASATTIVVALAYWPVVHAQFVFDDILDFQKMAWLRHGQDWWQFTFRKFNDWVDYFRPLGVALFTAEVRLFNVAPGPMHMVSLALHLLNTLLVGMLAASRTRPGQSQGAQFLNFALPMLLYGLHPLLVEPVVWIGCQFELTATLFMLLGWIANSRISRTPLRAATVAVCFFFAACSKESALSFPLVLVLFDWFSRETVTSNSKMAQLIALSRNWPTYCAVFVTGLVYLALRHRALGELVPNNGSHPLPIWARLQEASFLYLRYWRMFFWPSLGMGPLHPVPAGQFLGFSIASVAQDLFAAIIASAGIILTLRRNHIGGLILGITFCLLPVLHLVATNFDQSLYHERYAMTALAVACVWLPSVLREIPFPLQARRVLPLAATSILTVWLIVAVLTIRLTVPLWSSQIALWQWALEENPNYIGAKDELISAYIDEGAYSAAWSLINDVAAHNERCMNCMLNAASLSMKQNELRRASFYLQSVKDMPELYASPTSYRFYLTTIGQLELLEKHPHEAEIAARSAIMLDRLDPEPRLVLATALASQGKLSQAEQVEAVAIELLVPEERAKQRQSFEELLTSLRTQSAATVQ